MKLQIWLCWCMRFVLPFLGWRVPVALLRGPARGSGREVVLLSAGAKPDFILARLFAHEPVAEHSRRVPIWRLQRLQDEWRVEADLVAVQIDRISARLFLHGPHISVPLWVDSYMQVPSDWHSFFNKNKRVQSDIRRVRIKHYESHFSSDEADFDLFYERFYQPYVQARHQDRAEIVPRWRLRVLFKQGMQIQWLCLGGEKLAGCIVQAEGRRFHSLVNGLRDGSQELIKEGALSALYVGSIMEARRLGCTELHMGGSLPSLHDGVFRYKSKWTTGLVALYAHAPQHARALGCTRILLGGSKPSLHDGVLRYKSKWLDGLCEHDGHLSGNHVMLLRWNRLAGPVAEFLSHTALIHHEHGGYSALWVFPARLPLTAETLYKEIHELQVKGLRNLRIVLPGMPPPGFKAPPEVLCLELPTAEQVGAGGICSHTMKP